MPSVVFVPAMAYLSTVKSQLKHGVLGLIIAVCVFPGGPTQLQAADKPGYVTAPKDLPPNPSQQSWTQGNDVPSSTRTYHSPEVVLSAGNWFPQHQDFFVAFVALSTSSLSRLTYFRSRPRDPPAL